MIAKAQPPGSQRPALGEGRNGRGRGAWSLPSSRLRLQRAEACEIRQRDRESFSNRRASAGIPRGLRSRQARSSRTDAPPRTRQGGRSMADPRRRPCRSSSGGGPTTFVPIRRTPSRHRPGSFRCDALGPGTYASERWLKAPPGNGPGRQRGHRNTRLQKLNLQRRINTRVAWRQRRSENRHIMAPLFQRGGKIEAPFAAEPAPGGAIALT